MSTRRGKPPSAPHSECEEASRLRYVEHRPPTDLTPWIACVWRISGAVSEPFQHRVLPDGCADLLFDLEGARRVGGTPAHLIGPMSRAQLYEMRGAVDLIGVRLRPGVMGAFSGIPADRVLDANAPMIELPRALRVNVAQLADAPSFAARTELLTHICRTRVATLDQPDPLVRHALSQWS